MPRTKWEYKTLRLARSLSDTDRERLLNEAGQDCWELVQIIPAELVKHKNALGDVSKSDDDVAYLKREQR